jgi:hypothetical protein
VQFGSPASLRLCRLGVEMGGRVEAEVCSAVEGDEANKPQYKHNDYPEHAAAAPALGLANKFVSVDCHRSEP